jgi:sulfide:quinone oxidoreductase
VSPLADAAGWLDVDQTTLRHKIFDNIWSLGDVMNAPNAKTMAAARKQAPTVAENIVADIKGGSPVAQTPLISSFYHRNNAPRDGSAV